MTQKSIPTAPESSNSPMDSIQLGNRETTEKKLIRLTILHTNDMHGHLNPFDPKTRRVTETREKGKIGGLSYLANAINAEREKNPEGTLLLDGGDISTGTPISDLAKTAPMIETMNALRYDATVVGNHEFDRGNEHLRELIQSADFPFLSSNMVDLTEGTNPIPAAQYQIKEVNGLRIGLFGLTLLKSVSTLNAADRKEVELVSAADTAKRMVSTLRNTEKCDLVIALSHMGVNDDRIIAADVPGIDVIVGGHSHTELPVHEKVGNTCIIQSGALGKNLGVLNLDIQKNKDSVSISSVKSNLIPINGTSCEKDPDIEGIIKKYNDIWQPYLQRPIGTAEVDLIFEDYWWSKNETNMANFVTDTVREHTKADFCLFTPSTFRNSIPKGQVKVEDIHLLYPWPDGLATVQMKGSTIKNILEKGLAGNLVGVSPSGLRVKYDTTRPPMNRVLDVTTNSGEKLDPDRVYTVATKDFMLDAAEMYLEYKDYLSRTPVPETVPEILIKRFETGIPVATKIDGRLEKIA